MGATRVNKLLSTIGSGILVKVVADEFKAWNPKLTGYLVKRAVRRLPLLERERYEEEWTANLDDVPGDLSKMLYAMSLQRAAFRIQIIAQPARRRVHQVIRRTFEISFAAIMLLLLGPVLALIALLVRISSSGPVFVVATLFNEKHRPIRVPRFRTFSSQMTFDTDGSNVVLGQPHTAIGKFLREKSLDNLPALINLLRGDIGIRFFLFDRLKH